MGQQTESAAPHCWFLFLPWWQSMFVTFQQLWRMELGTSLHCRLISPVSWVTYSPSCLFTLKISEADAILSRHGCKTNTIAAKQIWSFRRPRVHWKRMPRVIITLWRRLFRPSVCDVPTTQPCVGFSWNSFFTKHWAIVCPKNIGLVTAVL
jgi:hypothetical protein